MLNANDVRGQMEKVMGLFVGDIGSIRTGRATPGLIENVVVTVYGQEKMRLKEVGSIGVPDVRTLTFQPWDQSVLREIANGISAANIGLTPVVEGMLIRMVLPMMTAEQREDYVKLLGRKLEGVRGMLREIRARARKEVIDAKNKRTISEDESRRDEAELQKMTDEYMGKLEEVAKKKEIEIRG